MGTRTITWTPARLEQLRKAYNDAVEAEQEQFTLRLKGEEPVELVTQYAKYLVEHLDGCLMSAC